MIAMLREHHLGEVDRDPQVVGIVERRARGEPQRGLRVAAAKRVERAHVRDLGRARARACR